MGYTHEKRFQKKRSDELADAIDHQLELLQTRQFFERHDARKEEDEAILEIAERNLPCG